MACSPVKSCAFCWKRGALIFYAQFAGEGAEALEAAAIEKRTAGQKIVFIGDALARFQELCPPRPGWRFAEGYGLPDPGLMARMGADGTALLPPEPLYLRGADVSQPKKRRKIILEGTEL